MTKRRESGHAAIARAVFRKAEGNVEPDVDGLVDAVPSMMAEARRRRQFAEQAGTLGAVVPLARRVIPALAAAAAVLVLVATLVGFGDTTDTMNGTSEYDRLVLTGATSGGGSDILLEAMTGRGSDDG